VLGLFPCDAVDNMEFSHVLAFRVLRVPVSGLWRNLHPFSRPNLYDQILVPIGFRRANRPPERPKDKNAVKAMKLSHRLGPPIELGAVFQKSPSSSLLINTSLAGKTHFDQGALSSRCHNVCAGLHTRQSRGVLRGSVNCILLPKR